MKDLSVLQKVKGKLIVSCQALDNEPLHGSNIMAKMAVAAKFGGAAGIRANTVSDIAAIKSEVDLPVIGIIKREYEDSEVYITPTIKEVEELNKVGVDIIAADFTNRLRPNGKTLEEFVNEIKSKFPNQLIMADISNYEEAIKAQELGADIVSTTLSGYTSYTKKLDGPDFELIERLQKDLKIPLIAEGRINSPEQAKDALSRGAFAVVVGGAITRPMEITKRFVEALD